MAKILVVDNDKVTTATLSRCFENELHGFFFAHTSAEAIRLRRQIAPDLLIIGNNLSDISGMALLRYFRGQENTKNVPIVMITEWGSIHEKLQAISRGADDYIEKPFDPPLMRARIKSVLQFKEMERRLEESEKLAAVGKKALDCKHDINNPLAGIIANIQLLQMQISDAGILKRLASIEELGFRISSIVEKIGKHSPLENSDVGAEEIAV